MWSPSDSAQTAFAITKSDTTVFPQIAVSANAGVQVTKAIYVGTAGDLAVVLIGTGTVVVFSNVPAGAILPISVSQVRSTSTTASNIVGLW